MDNQIKDRTDGAMLLGFEAVGDTYATSIEDSVTSQEVYAFLEPIARYRSVDSDGTFIVSWRPNAQSRERAESWRQKGLSVPSDVWVSTETLSLLTALNASEIETKNGTRTEISLPPLDETGLAFIKEELNDRHGLLAYGGHGVEPIRLDEDATRKLQSMVERPIKP